jgi:hypothetical protein
VDTWAIDPTTRVGVGVSTTTLGDGTCLWNLAPGSRVGVYQALSTRNGGEVLSADNC